MNSLLRLLALVFLLSWVFPSAADEDASAAYRRMVMMKGAWLFDRNCAFCHEKDGRGAVGPNLTDWYFLHGATKDDLRRVLHEGVPEKGMPTWKTILKPGDLRLIEHYVWSLRGKEVEGKAPEGEKHEPEQKEKDAVASN